MFCLSVNLYAGFASELPPGEVGVVAGVDVVVGQRLVHVLVDVQPVQEHWGILVAHQVVGQSLLAYLF